MNNDEDSDLWPTRQLFAVLKIAEVCNLKCPYCYFFFGGDNSFEKDPKRIPLPTVRAVAKYLAEGAVELGYTRVDISLHGGEPLMVGKRHFTALCEALIEGFEGKVPLGINMQTNATLVDREWAEIFRRFGIGVGISIDGLPEVHNRTRIDKKGRGTYAETIAGLETLREHHADVGALCVIDPDSDGAETYRHLVHVLGLRSLDFLLPLQNWDNNDPQQTAGTTRFYEGVTEAWLADNDPTVSIRTLSDPMMAMLSDKGAARRAAALYSASHAITIRSNGDVCPDDTLTSLNPAYRDTGFNVATGTLAEFMEQPFWREIVASNVSSRADCGDCRWWSICHGGHPDHRYGTESKFDRKTTYCQTYKSVFGRLENYISAAVPAAVLDARLGVTK
jgi:uncharacterized protein